MRFPIPADHEWTVRRARVVAALQDNAVASTATLVAVVSTIYRQTPDALGHAQRVASASTRIGRELRFSARELQHLE